MRKAFSILLVFISLNSFGQKPLFFMLNIGTGGGAGPFDPATTSPNIWYKAYGQYGKTNTNPLDSLTDYSGNANHALQTSAGNRPTYETNIQNSLPAIRFTAASSQYFSFTSAISSAVPYTLIMVYKKAANGDRFMAVGSNNASFNSPYTFYDYTDGNAYSWSNGNAYHLGTSQGNRTTAALISQTGEASNKDSVWVNKSNVTWASQSGTGPATNFVSLGRTGPTSGYEYANGYLMEVLFWTRKLTYTERNNVEDYLKTKWATP